MKLEYQYVEKIEDIRQHIRDCEGNHVQQVVYSTYHDALTQICYGCKRVRSNILRS